MKRKMIGAASAYLAGLFFASFFTGIKFAAILLLLSALVIIKGIRGKDILLLFVCFSCAFIASKTYGHFYYNRIVSLSGTSGDFDGRIVEIENYAGDLSLYTLKGNLDGVPGGVKVTYLGSGLNVEYGDILHLKNCTFSEYKNDYVFRNKDIFMAEGIFLSADYPESVEPEYTHSRPIKNALTGYREKMISCFRSGMDGETGNFLSAMVFGEKKGFDPDMRTSLYRIGIGHVMAVSGIHVSVIAVMLMTFFKLFRPGRVVPFVLMNILMFLFVSMAEWPVSAVRAVIMIDFVYLAQMFRRQSDTLNSLAAAVLIICIANPYAVYSSGFLLSVTASFGIGVFGPYMTENLTDRKFAKSVMIMTCTCLCIFPLSMKFFGETSLISPVTNLLFLPLCSAALVLGAIFVITGGVLPVLDLAELLLRPVLAASDIISRYSLTYFCFPGENSVIIVFALAAAVIAVHVVFSRRSLTASVMAAAFGAVMICSAISSKSVNESLRIAFLGRGRNTAAVITYQGSTTIFDLGGYYNAPVYVRKYLCENGISEADSLVLTKKPPSQYSAYISELKPVTVGKWYTADDIFVHDAGNIFAAGDEIGFLSDSLEIRYKGGELTAAFAENVISVKPSGSRKSLVVCGDVMNGKILIERDENGGMNNFEITLSEDGGYKFRRL